MKSIYMYEINQSPRISRTFTIKKNYANNTWLTVIVIFQLRYFILILWHCS